MKKNSLILTIIFLISMVSFQRTEAQDKSKAEMDKEMQKAIDDQKKAMVEQKKIQEEAQKDIQNDLQKIMEESKIEMDKSMENYKVIMDDPKTRDRVMRVYEDRGNRTWNNNDAFVFTPGMELYGRHFGGDTEGTSWEFSKNVKETTFSRDYTFDVEPTVKNVVMAVNGDCKEGEIRIKIITPGGKLYSDIVIDEFGNLNWRKSFNISDTENKDKTGAWKFEINSSKASGFFKISLQTF